MTHQASLNNRQTVSRRHVRLKASVVGFLAVGLVAGGFGALYFGGVLNNRSQTGADTDSLTESGEIKTTVEKTMIVTLSEGKLAAANIQNESVTRGDLIHSHHVPGRVAYDGNRRIKVTAPTSGILTQVLVKPGDNVQCGQTLAWLNSPEIGSARADVLQRQSRVELTSRLTDRARTLEKNVLDLTNALKEQPDFKTLNKEFADRILGDYREKILSAYSQMLLAEWLSKSSAELAKSGVLPGKVIQQRQSAAQSARVTVSAATEQAALYLWQKRAEAEATSHDAQRRLEIAQQLLASLLLHEAALRPSGDMPEVTELGASDNNLQHLCRVAVRAPFAGTIESRAFSASERVQATDSMFVLANTTSLWITAEIRENDWPAVSIKAGKSLSVHVPALGDATLQAVVEYIGREVAPDTNAIPIVARVDNSDGRLRPGLFVRVAVPVGKKNNVLTVPPRAVLQQNRQSFVFVVEGENRFRRVNVVTGVDGEERVEIVSGLNVGDQVVTDGAFVLKSELRLEGEGE